MCGIAGVMRWDGRPADPAVIGAMTDALRHRGPEQHGARTGAFGLAQVGLGHARLKIVDLSDAANQPMVNEDGSVWVVFNGEIYNFKELREGLERRGCRFRTSSDTEVLLRLYEAEGERALERLDGMFAFAIWDVRSGRLLLARDRVGKKPLFYLQTPTLFVFASEIKALLRHPEISAEVNTEALPALFLYGYVPTPRTCYRDIQSLSPGHWMELRADGQTRTRAYWDVSLPAAGAARRVSEADATVRIRELVTAAVRRRLIADVPLGAFLSGGLDSSIIVGVMSGLMSEPVRTFSIGFAGDRRFDETSYARLASERFKTRHTEFIVEPSAAGLIEQLVWQYDGPFADSSAIPTYLLSRLTRGHVTVALTGDGGDELFAGYLRLYAAVACERMPSWARRAAAATLTRLPEWGGHRSWFRYAQKFAGSAALPFRQRFSRWISVFYEDFSLLMPGLAEAGNGRPPAGLALQDAYWQQCQGSSPLTQALYLNLKTYLLDDLLVKMDRCSMAHALEARSPFLDRELLEYVFSLPDDMKLRWGRTKVVLRRAFAGLLPPEILTRGKMGFGVPLRNWFSSDLRTFLRDLLLAPDARLRTYLDQAYVRRLCEAHWSGMADHSHRLWTLLTFEVWLRNLSLRAAPPELSSVPAASPAAQGAAVSPA